MERDNCQGLEGQHTGNGCQCQRAGLDGILGRNCSLAGWAGPGTGWDGIICKVPSLGTSPFHGSTTIL